MEQKYLQYLLGLSTGQVGSVLGLTRTQPAGIEWRGRGARNRLSEKSVELVSGAGERRSVQSIAEVKNISKSEKKKICQNSKNLPESGKSCRNLKNLFGIFIFSRWNLKFFTKNCWNWPDLAKSH